MSEIDENENLPEKNNDSDDSIEKKNNDDSIEKKNNDDSDDSAQKNDEKEFRDYLCEHFGDVNKITTEAKNLAREIFEFNKISKVAMDELPKVNENNFGAKAAKINALASRMHLDSLKKVGNLGESEQNGIVQCFLEVEQILFEATKNIVNNTPDDWFESIASDIGNVFSNTEDRKPTLAETNEAFINQYGTFLALLKLLSKRSKKVDKTAAMNFKNNYKEVKDIVKRWNSRQSKKRILNNAKAIFERSKNKELVDFIKDEVLPNAKTVNEIYKRSESFFLNIKEELRNSIQRFQLPAMKTVAIATPIQKLIKATGELQAVMNSSFAHKAIPRFINRQHKNHFEVFKTNAKRAQTVIDIASKDIKDIDNTMKELEGFEQKIIEEKALSDRLTDKLEKAIDIIELAKVVQTLEQIAPLSKQMFKQANAVNQMQMFNFKKAGMEIKKRFQNL